MLNQKQSMDIKPHGLSKQQKIILQLLNINIKNSAAIIFNQNQLQFYISYILIISNKFNCKIKCCLDMEKDIQFVFTILDNINNQIKKKYDKN